MERSAGVIAWLLVVGCGGGAPRPAPPASSPAPATATPSSHPAPAPVAAAPSTPAPAPRDPSGAPGPLVPFAAPRDVWVLPARLRVRLPAGTTLDEAALAARPPRPGSGIPYGATTAELTTTLGGLSARFEETDWSLPADFEGAVRAVQIRLNGDAGREARVEVSADAPRGLSAVRVFPVHEPGQDVASRALVYLALPDRTVVLVSFAPGDAAGGDGWRPATLAAWRAFLRELEGSVQAGGPRPAPGQVRLGWGGDGYVEVTLPADMIALTEEHEHGVNTSLARVLPMDRLPEAIWFDQGCASMNARGSEGCRPRGRRVRGTLGGRPVTWTAGRRAGSRRLELYDEDTDTTVVVAAPTEAALATLRALVESARIVLDAAPAADGDD